MKILSKLVEKAYAGTPTQRVNARFRIAQFLSEIYGVNINSGDLTIIQKHEYCMRSIDNLSLGSDNDISKTYVGDFTGTVMCGETNYGRLATQWYRASGSDTSQLHVINGLMNAGYTGPTEVYFEMNDVVFNYAISTEGGTGEIQWQFIGYEISFQQ